MAEFMRGALAAVEAALESQTATDIFKAAELPGFREFKRVFTGLMLNPPTAWVMPGTTAIGDEGQTVDQASSVTVKVGVIGAEPEALLDLVLAYVLATDQALRAADYPVEVKRVWVRMHDYGKVLTGRNGFAAFAEIGLQVDMEEIA